MAQAVNAVAKVVEKQSGPKSPGIWGNAVLAGPLPALNKVSRVQFMDREELGLQHQVFYDLAPPLSGGNIQLAPWAEFALRAKGSSELNMLLT